jgi:negative modulator of initiation of replication
VRSILIDETVYRRIQKDAEEMAALAADILNRLPTLEGSSKEDVHPGDEHELTAAFADTKFRAYGAYVDKFLYILSVVHNQRKRDFGRVRDIRRGKRTYFATSEREIEESGTSTQPRQIPDSNYWVLTCSPTREKRDILREVLRLFGYTDKAVKAVNTVFR